MQVNEWAHATGMVLLRRMDWRWGGIGDDRVVGRITGVFVGICG